MVLDKAIFQQKIIGIFLISPWNSMLWVFNAITSLILRWFKWVPSLLFFSGEIWKTIYLYTFFILSYEYKTPFELEWSMDLSQLDTDCSYSPIYICKNIYKPLLSS